jgi:hypothetical protein
MNRIAIRFIAKKVYDEILLHPGNRAAELLFQLFSVGPRKTIKTNELHILSQIGFDIEIDGEVRELKKELNLLEEKKKSLAENNKS